MTLTDSIILVLQAFCLITSALHKINFLASSDALNNYIKVNGL